MSIQNDGNITAENLSEDTKRVLEEITRYLNMEKLLPCYRYVVTTACLKAISKLQKIVHLPPIPRIFRDNVKSGQFDDTRVDYIKLECKFEDLGFVIDMIENNSVPRMLSCQVSSVRARPPPPQGQIGNRLRVKTENIAFGEFILFLSSDQNKTCF